MNELACLSFNHRGLLVSRCGGVFVMERCLFVHRRSRITSHSIRTTTIQGDDVQSPQRYIEVDHSQCAFECVSDEQCSQCSQQLGLQTKASEIAILRNRSSGLPPQGKVLAIQFSFVAKRSFGICGASNHREPREHGKSYHSQS